MVRKGGDALKEHMRIDLVDCEDEVLGSEVEEEGEEWSEKSYSELDENMKEWADGFDDEGEGSGEEEIDI